MTEPGLRARKKQETRAALRRAALDLALRDGYDTVTVDAIAEAAHVSPRTFRNYFSSKEDAVLSLLADVERHHADTFLDRPADEPVLDSLEAAAIDLVESGPELDEVMAATRMVTGHPALTAHAAAVHRRASRQVLDEIARRLGRDPDTDLLPRLVFHAGRAVTASAVELLAHGAESPETARDLIREGFSQLRGGLHPTGERLLASGF
ncbi:MAG: TetR/AcrR family transcriptional regulator [Mycobacterium sp.]|nr:TetR/AcrR family transcriptional regulator [Mycobacterium sp.]HNM86441.1 TetR/AcrR family transcriptional regulator [Mycobacterium sp.]